MAQPVSSILGDVVKSSRSIAHSDDFEGHKLIQTNSRQITLLDLNILYWCPASRDQIKPLLVQPQISCNASGLAVRPPDTTFTSWYDLTLAFVLYNQTCAFLRQLLGPPTSWARMPGGASSSVTKGWNVWSKHHLSNGRSHPFGSHGSNPQIRLHHLASFTNPCMYILRSSYLWFLGMRASTLYLYMYI